MHKTLYYLEKYVAYVLIAALSVFVLPLFPNVLYPAKTALLVGSVAIILTSKAIRLVGKQEVAINRGSFDAGVLLVVLGTLASAIFSPVNKMEAFFLPGTATIIMASALFYFIILQDSSKKTLLGVATISGLLLALTTLALKAGIVANLPLTLVKSQDFSPTGGDLHTAVWLAATLPLAVWLATTEKDLSKKAFWVISGVLIIFGAVVAGAGSFRTLKLPSTSVSWAVAAETLKTSPLVGMGPANYITAFTRFRPLDYNKTAIWSLRFSSANNFYFTFLTETGIIGLAGLIILLGTLVAFGYKKRAVLLHQPALIASWLMLGMGLFLPLSPVTLVFLFVLLGISSDTRRRELELGKSLAPRLIITIPVLAVYIATFVYGYQLLRAEYTFQMALSALARNDGQKTFQLVNRTLAQNPYVDRYHTSLSQISMALVNSLAKKKDITDADRTTMARLIQIAIDEGKKAVVLNPQRSANWELLAATYKAIIPLNSEADSFALKYYANAVALDPYNPTLRIALGGVYYSLGRYDEAIETFKLATVAKTDYANAHYNLAFAYREKGETQKAVDELRIVLSLVPPDSSDYTLAKTELENLEKKLSASPQESENLSAPEKVSPKITPPIPLPSASPAPSQ